MDTTKISEIYDEFGLDVHAVPSSVQSQVNSLCKEVIKLRTRKSRDVEVLKTELQNIERLLDEVEMILGKISVPIDYRKSVFSQINGAIISLNTIGSTVEFIRRKIRVWSK